MSGKPVIAIFAQNNAQSRYLCDIVRLVGAEPVVTREIVSKAVILVAVEKGYISAQGQRILYLGADIPLDKETQRIELPVKAASIVNHLEKTLTHHAALPEKIPMGDAHLDTRENLWLREAAEAVRLTDREIEILIFLQKAGGKSVAREDLLHHVWAYASNVQTHTLETHIYRLRQKIERDPSAPKILLTQEDGYSLAAD